MYEMQGRPPDWQDFVGIITLLVINSTISYIEENNAGNAAAALMAGLAPKTKVIKDRPKAFSDVLMGLRPRVPRNTIKYIYKLESA